MTEAELERKVIDQAIELEELRPFRARWQALLPRVRMMKAGRRTTFFIRAGAVEPKDCSVAEHFTAAIDAGPQEKS